MSKVNTKKTKAKSVIEMIVVNPYACGIDVSDKEHVVAVPVHELIHTTLPLTNASGRYPRA